MLLGTDGHIKLADFGLSRYYNFKDDLNIPINELRSYSYCGTEQYMAVFFAIVSLIDSLKCCYDGLTPTVERSNTWLYFYYSIGD